MPPLPDPFNGKGTVIPARDDDVPTDGLILDIQLVQDSPYQSAYVIPISLGPALTQFFVQIDTGSSDLWVTSTACTSSLCSQVAAHSYDPSHSLPTGQRFHLQYAEGVVDGPAVWDSLQLGGYSIDHQAFIAAANVDDEPLSSQFNGVMGLALPSNSLIAHTLTPTTSDQPDGATVSSNLFGITPVSTAPGARFFSLALERPGSDAVRSTLGIGRHPTDLVSDPSKVDYAEVYSPAYRNPLLWQAGLRAITVIVDGVRKSVSIPASVTGAGSPVAILDSGVPLIVTTPTIANGIYGAMGISPAADGNYYVSCTTPMNITIQLDDRREVPLHPLDLTYFPPNDASSDMCIGSIQTTTHLGIALASADLILGVPFLRNTYTVMAYDAPRADGSFPANAADTDILEAGLPHLGLMPLTDPATAAGEFYQVRVLKQPLGTSAHSPVAVGGKGLSVGIKVLLGLVGFFAFCFILFGARWAYFKRKYARQGTVEAGSGGGREGETDLKGAPGYVLGEFGYRPASTKDKDERTSEDELRLQRFAAYKNRRRSNMGSQYTDDTGTTYVEDHMHTGKGVGAGGADELGALKLPETPRTPSTTLSTLTYGQVQGYFDTLVDAHHPYPNSPSVYGPHSPHAHPHSPNASLSLSRPPSHVEPTHADFDFVVPELPPPPPRTARRSDLSLSLPSPSTPPSSFAARRSHSPRSGAVVHGRAASGGPGVDAPLLGHGRGLGHRRSGSGSGSGSGASADMDIGEFGFMFGAGGGDGEREREEGVGVGMAGVGTVGRSRGRRTSGMSGLSGMSGMSGMSGGLRAERERSLSLSPSPRKRGSAVLPPLPVVVSPDVAREGSGSGSGLGSLPLNASKNASGVSVLGHDA